MNPDSKLTGGETMAWAANLSKWREIKNTFAFPFVMFALAIIPGLNFVYSGHGGIAWFLIPLCCPYVLGSAIVKLAKAQRPALAGYIRFYAIAILGYVVVALPLSWAATASLRSTFGLQVPVLHFWAIMISPFPYWYFS